MELDKHKIHFNKFAKFTALFCVLYFVLFFLKISVLYKIKYFDKPWELTLSNSFFWDVFLHNPTQALFRTRYFVLLYGGIVTTAILTIMGVIAIQQATKRKEWGVGMVIVIMSVVASFILLEPIVLDYFKVSWGHLEFAERGKYFIK